MSAKPKPRAAAAQAPDGWEFVRFGEIANCIGDRVDDPSKAGVERYVGLKHLDPESLKIRRWGKPTDVEAQKLRFKPGDIIFGKRRAYQKKLAVADFEGICSAHAMVLRANTERIEKDFLPFFMQSDVFFDRALAISVGSLSPTINWRTLAEQEFCVPPRAAQRGIIDLLRSVVEVQDRYSVALDLIDELRLALIRSLAPAAGRTVDLGTLASVITSGSRGWAEHYTDDGAFFVRVTNLRRDRLSLDVSDVKFVSPPEDQEGTRTRVQPSDILMSITADLGRVALAGPDIGEAYVNQHVALIRVPSGEFYPRFIGYYLLTPDGQREIKKFNDAGAKAGMNLQNVARLRIPVMPRSAQIETCARLDLLDACSQSLIETRQRAAKLERLVRAMVIDAECTERMRNR